LSAYSGDLLIVAAENDGVIPTGVIEKLYESAVKARRRKLYIAPGVSHFIFTELRSQDPDEYERAMGKIVKMLK
jgi:fermentation-respiration switch protein FrsA (DUF1100 family)